MGVFELLDEHYKMQQGGTWEKQKAKVQKEKHQGNNLLEMLQEDKDLIERLSKKDRIKKETNTKTSDNTKVNAKNKPELTSKSARNKTDKEIAEERKAKIEESVKYQDVPFTQDNWREVLAKETQSTGDKFRVSLEPNFFDDYLNPAVMVGGMASNLGQAPLQAQQEDSYMPYVTAVGTPLAVGAMAGLGTQNTGQFVNNLANPLAGTGDLVNNLGNKTKQFIRGNILTDKTFNRLETINNAMSDKTLKFLNPQHHLEANKALKEANNWMEEWYNHPNTLQRIEDINYGSFHADDLKNRILNRDYKADFETTVNKFYNLVEGEKRVHKGNSGVSGYNLDLYQDNSRRQNLVDKYIDKDEIISTAIHEGNHGFTDGNRGIEYGYTLQKPFDLSNFKPRKETGEYLKYDDYLLDPTEISARVSEIRYENGIKPDQKITQEDVNNLIDKGLSGKSKVDKRFYELIKDRDVFGWMINKVPAIAPITGATYLATQDNKQQGGKINYSENEKKFLDELARLKLI